MSHLRQRMQDRMDLRGLADSTQYSYMRWITKLAGFHHISPDLLSDDQLQAFMLYLINTRRLSSSSCRQAIHSMRFFYTNVVGREVSRFALPSLRSASKIPELLSCKEVFSIIQCCTNLKYRTMLLVGYGRDSTTGEGAGG